MILELQIPRGLDGFEGGVIKEVLGINDVIIGLGAAELGTLVPNL